LAAALPILFIGLPVLLRFGADFSDGETAISFIQAFRSARTWRVLSFSLSQAALSALISLLLGFPAAYYAAYWDFRAKPALRVLFSLPFILPSLLLALGLSGLLGNAGTLNDIISALGLPRRNFIYGMRGVIIAHAFFNFPIAARLIHSSLAQSDPSLREAAAILGAGRARQFLTIVVPEALPGALSAFFLIFLYCFQSFGIILLLGGGPEYSTLEVEIYQAMRLTFQPGSAACFAAIELAVGLLFSALYARFSHGRGIIASAPPRERKLCRPRGIPRLAGGAYSLLALLILAGPLVSILIQSLTVRSSSAALSGMGFKHFASLFSGAQASGVLRSCLTTLSVGCAAATLACLVAFIATMPRPKDPRAGIGTLSAILPLAISPLILSRSLAPLSGLISPIACLIVLHAALALPLAAQCLHSGLSKIPGSLEEAARCLGASPLRSIVDVRLPLLKKPLASAFLLSFCVSAGDVAGVLSLRLGDLSTLSLRIYRLAGAYRFEEACALGVILLAVSGAAIAFMEEQ
jgi:thiamine transport system permease protein